MYQKGKGYQEFEMIDAWLESVPTKPKDFIKITGRYIIKNISEIIEECRTQLDAKIIIEKNIRNKYIAFTDIFYIKTEYYYDNVFGKYKLCDDEKNIFIEHVMRFIIDKAGENRVFRNYPLKFGITGSEGIVFGNKFTLKVKSLINNMLFKIYSNHRLL
jgi:hypothetical protein